MAKKAYIGVPNFVKRDLPSGYTQVEYIESNGSQHIDTGFMPNQDTRVVMDFESKGVPDSYNAGLAALFGARDGTSSNAFDVWFNDSEVYPQYGSVGYNKNGYIGINTIARLRYDFNKNVLSIASETNVCGSASFSTSYPMYVFTLNNAGKAQDRKAVGKLYSCQIYDNGTLVRDYVPCRNASGVAGLYDMVNATFSEDAAGGAFVAGETAKSVAHKIKKAYLGIENFTKRNLPSGYTQVEYIESTGKQYVDTGFTPNQDTRVVAKVIFELGTSTTYLLGARTSTSSSDSFVFVGSTNGYYASGYGKSANLSSDFNRSVPFVLDKNKSKTYIDGVEAVSAASATFTSPNSMYLFGVNQNGSAKLSASRYYYCQVYDNGVLIRDYVPCTNASGVAGLYEMVSGEFCGNAGTGAFAIGSSTHTSTAHRIKKAYIGVGGVARPCWSGGELVYYGNLGTMSQGLSAARQYFTATSVGDYAVFAGGYGSAYSAIATVDAFSSSLVRTVPSAMTYQQDHNASATVNDIAMFAGISGNPRTAARIYATSYNASLTKTDLTSLPDTVYALAAASIGDYVLFGGGTPGSYQTNRVTTYNSALTQGSAPNLDISSSWLAATTIGGYALFAGGANGWPDSAVSNANAYDASLTKVAIDNLSVGRFDLTACSTNEYAIFAGGQGGENNPYQKTVEVYDASLTRRTVNGLSIARSRLASTGVGDFAVIAGGQDGNVYYETVDAYDSSLTRTTATSLTSKREGSAATTIGNYALIAGGSSDSYTAVTSAVWVYTVV